MSIHGSRSMKIPFKGVEVLISRASRLIVVLLVAHNNDKIGNWFKIEDTSEELIDH